MKTKIISIIVICLTIACLELVSQSKGSTEILSNQSMDYSGTYRISKVISTDASEQDRIKKKDYLVIKKISTDKYSIKFFSNGKIRHVYTGELAGNIITIQTLVQFTIEFTDNNEAIIYILGDQLVYIKD